MLTKRTCFVACIIVLFAGLSLSAAEPVITGVSIPDDSMKIGDVVTVTINVQSDVSVYTLSAGSIGGYALSGLSKVNNTTYTTQFTISSGGTDYAAGTDIPTDVTLADGALTDTWTIAISQANDPIDANAPTVTISDDEAGTANIAGGDVTYTFDFSETITGFTADDIDVANGTKGSFTPVSGTQFTLVVTPAADLEGDMTVDVAAGVATDGLGNPNVAATQSVQYVDTLAPYVTAIDLDGDSPTNAGSVTYTVSFSEEVSDIETGDFALALIGTSGTVSGVTDSTAISLTVAVGSIAGDGTLGLNFEAGALDSVVDQEGNPATTDFTGETVTIDNTAPSVTVNIVDDALDDGDNSSVVTFEFSEAVEDFTLGDADEWGGTLSSFVVVDADSYTAVFTATDGTDTTGSVTVLAGTYTDLASNNGAEGSDTVDIDTENPTISQIIRDDVNPTNAAQVSIQVDFSESVDGVAIGSFSLITTGAQAGASIDSVVTSGPAAVWIVRLNTVDDATGTLTLDLNSNLSGITDASGNELLVGRSADEVYDVDRLDPTVTVNIVDAQLTDTDISSVVTFEFDEDVVGFTIDDLTPTNGSLGSFSAVDADSYTVVFTATDGVDGTGSVAVGTGYTDTLGNSGTPGSDTVDIDRENPTVAVTIIDALLTDADNASMVTLEFSEAVQNFTIDDLTPTNGTLSSFTPVDADSYTVVFTATDGTEASGSVSVGAGTYTDLVGNNGGAGSDTVDIDTLNPTVTGITANDSWIADEDTPGDGTFTIRVTFSETMDPSVRPTILFDQNLDSTLTPDTPPGAWTSATVYEADYDIADGNKYAEDVRVDVEDAQDTNGNPMQDYTPGAKTFDVDTENPLATVVFTDSLLTDADAESLVTITFSEAVNNLTIDDLTPTNGSLTTFTQVNLAEWTVIFTALDGVDGTGTVAVGMDYEDYRGNPPNSGDSGGIDVDTENPSILTVEADTSPMYEGNLVQRITVTFDEAMLSDGTADPSISFVSGTFTSQSDGAWSVGDTVWTETFDLTDNNEEIADVLVEVASTKDAVGNVQQPYTSEGEFDIDTLAPTVTNLYLSSSPDITITDWDVADATQDGLYVHFSEPMTNDGSADPVFTFEPGITHTLPNGDNSLWVPSNPDTVYGYFTDALDADTDVDSVRVDVTGARDANGNLLVPYSQIDVFGIDTLNPKISSITSITPDGYYNSGTIDVTVTFSEQVTLSGGTLDVTLDTPSDLVSITAFAGWPDASVNYTIASGDNSCDLDAISIVLNGGALQDLFGNDAVVALPVTTIADDSDIVVDTTNPAISGLDLPDTTQDIGPACSITIPYLATLTDNCCINTGVGATDVQVIVSIVGGTGTGTLDAPPATITNNGVDRIDVSGNLTISDVSGGDVVVQVEIDCIDCAGNSPDAVSDTVTIDDISAPAVSGFNLPDNTLYMDPDTCVYRVPFNATVLDNCCLDHSNVTVDIELVPEFDTALLNTFVSKTNAGGTPNTQVDITGWLEVHSLTDDPVHARVRINASDCNGNVMTEVSDTAVFEDGTAPTIGWNTDLPDTTQYVNSSTCIIVLPVQATVIDACCIDAKDVAVDIQLTNATLDHDVTVTQISPSSVDVSGNITVSSLTGCPATLSIAIDGTDCVGNDAVQLTDSVVIRDNTPPVIEPLVVLDNITVTDDCCVTPIPVTFAATVIDNCCLDADNVSVTVELAEPNATLEYDSAIDLIITQLGDRSVGVAGSAIVRCLTGCPARVVVTVNATDCCGNFQTRQSTDQQGRVYDRTVPEPLPDPYGYDDPGVRTLGRRDSDMLEVRFDDAAPSTESPYRLVVRENTPVRIDVLANDDDNCTRKEEVTPCRCCGTLWVHDIPTTPEFGVVAIVDDDNISCTESSSIRYLPNTGYIGRDTFSYRPVDACGNLGPETWVYLEVVSAVQPQDVFLNTCQNESIEIEILASDVYINHLAPEEIPFTFSIDDGFDHGVLIGSLTDLSYAPPSTEEDPDTGEEVTSFDAAEYAKLQLRYVPAAGYAGRDTLEVRFSDPWGLSDTILAEIWVSDSCAIPDAAFQALRDESVMILLPDGYAAIHDTPEGAASLICGGNASGIGEHGQVSWNAAADRYVLMLSAENLPPGGCRLLIPIGNDEYVDLRFEVGEAR